MSQNLALNKCSRSISQFESVTLTEDVEIAEFVGSWFYRVNNGLFQVLKGSVYAKLEGEWKAKLFLFSPPRIVF